MTTVDPPHHRVQAAIRSVPIRWRILSIAALNSAFAIVLLVSIWSGATILGESWSELRNVRRTESFLNGIDRETERLQGLIHRYNTRPDARILDRITGLRETLVSRLRNETRGDLIASDDAEGLTRIIERFLAGFDALRAIRAGISRTYDQKISRPSREMAGLYSVIEGVDVPSRAALLAPLAKSREAFHAMLLAANAYYLSTAPSSATEVGRNAASIRRTVPVMLDLAEDEIQRLALAGLRDRAETFASGVDDLANDFQRETRILQDDIDGSTDALSSAIETLTRRAREVEGAAQLRFDATLADSASRLTAVSLAFFGLVALLSTIVSKSLSEPLSALRTSMLEIADGSYHRRPPDTAAGDEIGDMARAVEVFRQNALAKVAADEEVRAAKERAEAALSELSSTQASLIEAEKFAALGGLVAGVAHEVNNPVGIGLTVASSLTHRVKILRDEIAAGPLRRSQLTAFIAGVEDAAGMIVANLGRASELVQSFKQVAVDRSSHGRRRFDLAETCDQILASLRPGLKTSSLELDVRIPDGIVLDSYPGPLGQILTNLFLNAVRHGYPTGEPGRIELEASCSEPDRVTLTFSDDGRGMSEDVRRRAFEPFFTTSRGAGGTGLGLHIVYNIATHQLGGRVSLLSSVGGGCRFVIAIPTVAPTYADNAWVPQFA